MNATTANQMPIHQDDIDHANLAMLNVALDALHAARKASIQACATSKAADLTVKECEQLRSHASRAIQENKYPHISHTMAQLIDMVNCAASIAAVEARATVNRTRNAHNDACTTYETLAGTQ